MGGDHDSGYFSENATPINIFLEDIGGVNRFGSIVIFSVLRLPKCLECDIANVPVIY